MTSPTSTAILVKEHADEVENEGVSLLAQNEVLEVLEDDSPVVAVAVASDLGVEGELRGKLTKYPLVELERVSRCCLLGFPCIMWISGQWGWSA